jgi:hypothetical protein
MKSEQQPKTQVINPTIRGMSPEYFGFRTTREKTEETRSFQLIGRILDQMASALMEAIRRG